MGRFIPKNHYYVSSKTLNSTHFRVITDAEERLWTDERGRRHYLPYVPLGTERRKKIKMMIAWLFTLAMRLRWRLVASAGTMRHNLSYSCCCNRRIDALRYLRHTLRPATARRPPTGDDPALDRARAGWSPTALTAADDPKLDWDRVGRKPTVPMARRRTNGVGRPDFCRNICNIEHRYRYR